MSHLILTLYLFWWTHTYAINSSSDGNIRYCEVYLLPVKLFYLSEGAFVRFDMQLHPENTAPLLVCGVSTRRTFDTVLSRVSLMFCFYSKRGFAELRLL